MQRKIVKRGAASSAVAAVAAGCVAAGVLGAGLPVGGAQEVTAPENVEEHQLDDADLDELMDYMSDLSEKATAKSEELKEKQEQLDEATADLERLEVKAADAGEDADSAAQAVDDQRQTVKDIAGSRYRGVNYDSVTTALASGDPQLAVERLGYLGALSRSARSSLATLSQNAADASRMLTDAETAADRAAKMRDSVEEEKLDVERQAEKLEQLQREVEERVDSFSEDQRQAWENRLNPLAPEQVDEMLPGDVSSVVNAALSKQGSPYGWGVAGPNQFDCSGLMYWAYQQEGKTIPRTSQAQIAGGTPVSPDALQPGDIVGYYPGVTHVGMYIGNGQIVHASDYGIPVQVVPVDSMPISGAARY